MKKLAYFYRAVDAFGVFAGLYIVDHAEAWLETQHVPLWLIWVIAFLIIGIIVRVFHVVAARAVNRIRLVRKMILGPDFIEGVWVDMLQVEGEPFCAISNVYIRDSRYHVVGEQFDTNGDLIVTWATTASDFDGDTLRYLYRARYNRPDRPEELHGISLWNFIRTSGDKAPISFSGYFVDITSGFKSEVFGGFKLKNKADLRALENQTPKRELIIRLMREHAWKSPARLGDAISPVPSGFFTGLHDIPLEGNDPRS